MSQQARQKPDSQENAQQTHANELERLRLEMMRKPRCWRCARSLPEMGLCQDCRSVFDCGEDNL